MSRHYAVLAASILAQVAVAQGTARLEGRVLSTTGEPVAKAEVRLLTPIPGTALDRTPVLVEVSDQQGRYVFPAVPAGRYMLSSEKTGFATGEYRPSGTGFFSGVTLAAGEVARGIDLRMRPQAVVTGRVVDADGDPVARAQVRLVRRGYWIDGLGLTGLQPVESDDRGVFRLTDLPEGRYFLMAEDPRSARAASPLEVRGASAQDVNLATYYPSDTDPRRAGLLTVRLGTELTSIDIQMRKGRLYSVRGLIVDSAGLPAMPLLLLKSATPSAAPVVKLVPRGGQFEIRLPPGAYFLLPEPSATGGRVTGRLEFSVSASDVQGLELRLAPSLQIPGRVTVDGGSYAALPPGPLATSIFLTPADGTIANVGRTMVDPDGAFRISNVPAARYALGMNLPTGTYVKSVRLGNQDTTSRPVDLGDGRVQPIEITLGADSAELTGVVRNAGRAPVAGAYVALWPETPVGVLPSSGSYVVTTNANGEFRIRGIAPGQYHVISFERIEPQFVQAYELLRRFNSVAAMVTLGSAARETIDPILISREAMAEEEGRLR